VGFCTYCSVTATEVSTNTTYHTVTSQAGTCNLPQVLVGQYDVVVTAGGFKSEKRTGIVVAINTPSALDVSLSLGNVSETVTVSPMRLPCNPPHRMSAAM
jgi:hypothetical protein